MAKDVTTGFRTGFDIVDEYNVFDVKGCQAYKWGGNIFLEGIQNRYKPPGADRLANMWTESFCPNMKYFLVYIDWSSPLFTSYVFSCRGLRDRYKDTYPSVKSGKTGLGYTLSGQSAQYEFHLRKEKKNEDELRNEINQLLKKYKKDLEKYELPFQI